MFSLDYVQEQIAEFLNFTVFPGQETVEHSYEDVQFRVLNQAGSLDPYVAYTFADIQQEGTKSMVGPRGDDYVLPVRLLCVAPTAAIARQLSNRSIDLFLGADFEWAGQVRKRAGGAIFPMTRSDGAVQAYVAPVSFGIVCQLVTL